MSDGRTSGRDTPTQGLEVHYRKVKVVFPKIKAPTQNAAEEIQRHLIRKSRGFSIEYNPPGRFWELSLEVTWAVEEASHEVQGH